MSPSNGPRAWTATKRSGGPNARELNTPMTNMCEPCVKLFISRPGRWVFQGREIAVSLTSMEDRRCCFTSSTSTWEARALGRSRIARRTAALGLSWHATLAGRACARFGERSATTLKHNPGSPCYHTQVPTHAASALAGSREAPEGQGREFMPTNGIVYPLARRVGALPMVSTVLKQYSF